MLMRQEGATERIPSAALSEPNVNVDDESTGIRSSSFRLRLARMLRIEWLGQTIASICWIGSVCAYGISSSGDWLQMSAALAWLTANLATVVTIKPERDVSN